MNWVVFAVVFLLHIIVLSTLYYFIVFCLILRLKFKVVNIHMKTRTNAHSYGNLQHTNKCTTQLVAEIYWN